MTTTTYLADFTDANSGKFHGSIAWDKHTPRVLFATLGRVLPDGVVDYPSWNKSTPHTARRERALVTAMQREAATRGWSLTFEEFTHHSTNYHTPRALIMELAHLLRCAGDAAENGNLEEVRGCLVGGVAQESIERAEKFIQPK
ncbi:MAG: hypothetical protein KGL39_58040 [Patescibacteria group bacterium]|nr:hypothetical protein [Patescibacteria group bacterium]